MIKIIALVVFIVLASIFSVCTAYMEKPDYCE